MNIQQLEKLVKQGESETVEFKKSTALLRSAFETICAFLNGKGGTVLIGVNDKGDLIGQNMTDNTRQEIANELNKIEPPAHLKVHYISMNKNKSVIAIRVNTNHHAPYIYDGRAFHRNQSTTSRMLQHRYEQLLVMRGQLNHSWEEMIAKDYKISDLDHEEILKTIADGIRERRIPASAQAEDVKTILKRLDLMQGNQLKNAAVVLYSKQKSLKLLQCMMKMARFKGTDMLRDFIDNQQIRENAFSLLESADAFLHRHLPIASFFKDQFKRIDKPALPVMAVREALINALCHRDYSDRVTDISLAIFDDRLVIWNGGTLPARINIEDLRHKHDSVPRNKLIANAFYVRGLIEKWGSGTNKMIDLCKEDSIPEPTFTERTGGLAVTFQFKEPIGATVANIDKSSHLSPYETLNTRQKLILEYITETKKASTQQICDYLSLKFKEFATRKTIVRDLNYMKSLGLVVSQGQSRKLAWIIP
jgi:ATP-dependent DNA helicase RecG